MKFKFPQLRTVTASLILFGSLLSTLGQNTVDESSQSGTIAPTSGVDPGTYNYQADLFTGRFTYSIPIAVAPARQGAEPKITLGYNSAAGNGWCGVGWTLDMGCIQRDSRHGVPIAWAQSTQVAGGTTNFLGYNLPLPQYDDTKGFVSSFGGVSSTLVEVGPTNQNPIIYHQQVDTSFLTYEYFTNDYWAVLDKSGNTFYFGESTNCQMENSKTNWHPGAGSSTWRWALDRVVDVNGNETFLNYTLDSGELYLTNIMYNANTNAPALAASDEVDFILTNRPDTNFTFTCGYRVTSRQLLSEIDIKAGGQNVRKYVLGYTQSSSTLRTLLSSVTQYGSDFVTALPPITFGYQVKPFTFGPDISWPGLYSYGDTGAPWNAIRLNDSTGYITTMADIDGDGLPDRVMRAYNNTPLTNYLVLRNTGAGFAAATNDTWGPLQSQGQTDETWNDVIGYDGNSGTVYLDLADINGDGYPDRVMDNISSYTNFVVQLNNGALCFSNYTYWGIVTNDESTSARILSVQWNDVNPSETWVDFLDMNGDGLPDRLSVDADAPYTNFDVQANTGSGFTLPDKWGPLDSQGQTSQGWNALSTYTPGGAYTVAMIDINGDGLPDRVMSQVTGPCTNFVVQFNNGAGFEPAEFWGPLNTQGFSNNISWIAPIGFVNTFVVADTIDINGDGLPDHVMEVASANGPYTNWIVQLNTGSGFGPPINFGPVDGQGQSANYAWNAISGRNNNNQDTVVDFFDINGDGLPDRVMAQVNGPYTNFVVQLNQGPYPDLLNVVSNGLGGSVQVSYIASTTLNNRSKDWTNDPWAEGAKSLLPFNVWVVSQIVTSDGMGNNSTNSYAFKGGYYNWQEKEFRGFSQCTQTDPLGTKTITYFHQSGGRDNSALGEYMDQGSESKKGIPFRIDLIGNDGSTNKITLNKVEEAELNSNGWYFPFVAQTIEMNYEGLPAYRATAKQFTYDTNAENLLEEADLGEVTNVIFNGQTYTDVGNDSIYTWTSYTNFAKASDIKITSDSIGANRLRETEMFYDSRGNLANDQVWQSTTGSFVSINSTIFDQYGNPIQGTDASGITTYTTYDSLCGQYPIFQVTAMFTNQVVFDFRSGSDLESIDAKGLVTSNVFDVFFRPIATYISTNPYAPPLLWKTRVAYSLGGIAGTVSSNCVIEQDNDDVNPNGLMHFTYFDGQDRAIQTRAESEILNQYRVINTCYDARGNQYFKTVPYFGTGTNFTVANGAYTGSLTEFDVVNRPFRSTPAVQGNFSSGILQSTNSTGGDIGSPTGATTTAYNDGNNPWANVLTDPMGKVANSYFDAYGRKIKVVQVTSGGNLTTSYGYDLFGDLTNITDPAGNSVSMTYDSRGQKLSVTDPDMGNWTYTYDTGGKMTSQTDAKGNKLVLTYSDPVGRLTTKQIYNSFSQLVGTVTYTYDVSDDPNYTVYKGELYKVTDLQGFQRNSYDVQGRLLKTGRFLNINSMEYVTGITYDDADRVSTLTYPGNSATIQYAYDAGGNLSQVESLSGTGTNEVFYTPRGFNAPGEITGYTNGNGVITAYTYYADSLRLENITTSLNGTNYQNQTYTYDTNADLASLSDSVYTSTASAALSSISYDDLYRVTGVNSTARGIKSYSYSSAGNILTNQDFGPGAYQYGSQPHAVISANGVSYDYDACGNMVARGNQTLAYDALNQLVRVSATNDTVFFGYDDSGTRLWRCGTNGYTVWIGNIYEINNGKILCHVMAGDKRIATFEPECNAGLAKVFGQKNWYIVSTSASTIISWPFKNGRGQWTIFGGTWLAILGICMTIGRNTSLRRTPPCGGRNDLYNVRGFHIRALWRQGVTLTAISAILLSGIGNVDAAPIYDPVFYFYSTDYLGSSNILTDRSGNLVQHYEYSTFGQTAYQNNTSAFPVSNRYTGQIADDETGLYYYDCRYYDAQLGRFIQPDTTFATPGVPQSLNHYSYCGNNPVNCTDPSGHGWFSQVMGNLGKMFTNPVTYVALLVGFCMGGPGPAIAALVITMAINVVVTTVAYCAGQEAGFITGCVLSIALGIGGVAIGSIGATGVSPVESACSIVSSALAIGSTSASLAGDDSLSNDFGYASLAIAGVGAADKIYNDHGFKPPSLPEGSIKGNDLSSGQQKRNLFGNQNSASNSTPAGLPSNSPEAPVTGLAAIKNFSKSLGESLFKSATGIDYNIFKTDMIHLAIDFFKVQQFIVQVAIGAVVGAAAFVYYAAGNSLDSGQESLFPISENFELGAWFQIKPTGPWNLTPKDIGGGLFLRLKSW